MSRSNVDVVQAAYDAYFRGDVELLRELASPDIVVNLPPDQPDVRSYEGHDGLIAAIEDWTGEWEDYRLEVLGMVEASPHVIVTVRQRGRGKASGVEVEAVHTFVHTLEAGRLVRWQMFTSREQALEAVEMRGDPGLPRGAASV